MQQQVYIELDQLALEFQTVRQSRSNKFPQDIWKRAISIATKLSVNDVSKALHIAPAYLYKKIKNLSSDNTVKFVEANFHSLASSGLVISIEAPAGRMKIEGATNHSLQILISEFVREGARCSK